MTRRVPALLLLSLLTPVAGATPGAFPACIDYHCDETRSVQLQPAQWQAVRALLARAEGPAGEREQIRRAIALLETQVGRITGTWRDLGENARGAGLPGQLDCISESRNTTTYLRLMAADGLLRWHEVLEPVVRQRFIFIVHWTAAIRDRSDGRRYAVDSWFLDNGEPPYVQPLEDWLAGRDFDVSG